MAMSRLEEQQVIERAAAGDRDAADQLVRAYQRSLYAYILRLSGRPDVAEDVVQDAFVRVLTNLDRFDPRFRFSTWLFTIAKRLYVNAMQRLRPVYDSEVVGACQGDGSLPESPIIENEQRGNERNDLATALGALTGDQRDVVVLFHQQEWSITAISEYLGMPEGTVKSHLHRGRRRMKVVMEQLAEQRTSHSTPETVAAELA